MFISLSSVSGGYACAIKTIITKFTKQSIPSLFCDTILISLRSLIEIFDTQVTEKLTLINQSTPVTNPVFTCLQFPGFDQIISVHDLNEGYNKDDLKLLQEKYIRRYERFLARLGTTKEKIYFLRFDVEFNEDLVIQLIAIINSFVKVDFTLVFLYDHPTFRYGKTLCQDSHFKAFNFHDFKKHNDQDEKNLYLRIVNDYDEIWNKIFERL